MQAFNTMEQFENLRIAGMNERESEAIIKSIERLISNSGMVTVTDIDTLKKEIKFELMSLKVELQNFIVKSVMTAIMILSSLQTLYHFYR